MSNNKLTNTLDNLSKILENPEKITMGQLESLLLDTLSFFDSIRDNLTSTDDTIRGKAMDEAAEMQDKLNQIANKLYEKTGMTKEQAEQFITNPNNFKKEDWNTMKNMEKEIGNLRKSI